MTERKSPLPARLQTCLQAANLTAEQARAMTDYQLLCIPGMGRRTLRHLRGQVGDEHYYLTEAERRVLHRLMNRFGSRVTLHSIMRWCDDR